MWADAKAASFHLVVLMGSASFVAAYLIGKTGSKARLHRAKATLGSARLITLLCYFGVASVLQLIGQLYLSGISSEAFLACPICETSLTGKKNVALSATFFIAVQSFLDVRVAVHLAKSKSYGAAIALGAARALFYISSLGTGRVMLLISFSLPLVLVALHRGDLEKRLVQLLAGGVLALAALPFFYVMNELRHGGLSDAISLIDSISSLQSDLNPGANLDLFISHIDEKGYDYGFFLISPLIAFIPRFIYPDKPITSLQFFYTQEIFGIDPISDITTYTFTIFDAYSAFGGASVVLVCFLYGLLFGWAYRRVSSGRVSTSIFCIELCLLSVNIFRTNLFDGLVFLVMRYGFLSMSTVKFRKPK